MLLIFSSGKTIGQLRIWSARAVTSERFQSQDGSRPQLTIGSAPESLRKDCSDPSESGALWDERLTQNVIWYVVRDSAKRAGIDRLAPHDLRRSWARMCHLARGELEQIQFLLGHASVQTTERYLGCKQRIRQAVNDRIDIQFKIHG